MGKETLFINMKCCKCNKTLGMGIFNETFHNDSFIPTVNRLRWNYKTLDFYCNECYVKEVLNIDL